MACCQECEDKEKLGKAGCSPCAQAARAIVQAMPSQYRSVGAASDDLSTIQQLLLTLDGGHTPTQSELSSAHAAANNLSTIVYPQDRGSGLTLWQAAAIILGSAAVGAAANVYFNGSKRKRR